MSLSVPLSIPVPRRALDDVVPATPSTTAGPPARALTLLVRARTSLRETETLSGPRERYVAAHVAALRAASAVVIARASGRAEVPTSVWALLRDCAPELCEWSEFFEAGSQRRALAEAGIPGVSAKEADALVRRSREFVELVMRSVADVAR